MSKRKFNRLKGVNKACDEYAQLHDRRPFVFGFTTEAGSVCLRDGSVPVGLDEELTAIWTRLCQMSSSDSMDALKAFDKKKKKATS